MEAHIKQLHLDGLIQLPRIAALSRCLIACDPCAWSCVFHGLDLRWKGLVPGHGVADVIAGRLMLSCG